MFILFTEEQQEVISKAKDTIATATEKCKDVENKMKVTAPCKIKLSILFFYFGSTKLVGSLMYSTGSLTGFRIVGNH